MPEVIFWVGEKNKKAKKTKKKQKKNTSFFTKDVLEKKSLLPESDLDHYFRWQGDT